jgi:hypothetical protein
MRQSGYCNTAGDGWMAEGITKGTVTTVACKLTKQLSADGRAIGGCNIVAEMTGHGSGPGC